MRARRDQQYGCIADEANLIGICGNRHISEPVAAAVRIYGGRARVGELPPFPPILPQHHCRRGAAPRRPTTMAFCPNCLASRVARAVAMPSTSKLGSAPQAGSSPTPSPGNVRRPHAATTHPSRRVRAALRQLDKLREAGLKAVTNAQRCTWARPRNRSRGRLRWPTRRAMRPLGPWIQ